MKLINRGFILVKPKQAYWDWANQFNDDNVEFSAADESEGSIYLVEEDFFDVEPLIEKNFKKIFKNELESVNDDTTQWPEKLSIELFQEWFSIDFGSSVFDLEKTDLLSEKLG